MVLPAPDVGAGLGMVAQFLCKLRRRFAKGPDGNKQKWCGWQNWQNDPDDAETDRKPSKGQIEKA